MHDHTCSCGHSHEHEEDCCCGHEHEHGHAHDHAHSHADNCDCGGHHNRQHDELVAIVTDAETENELLDSGWLLGGLHRTVQYSAPEPTREFDFSWNGQTLHVYQWGEEGIPVVMLHGFMQTGMSWAGVASNLAEGRCVYALDFIGHGKSSKPAQPEFYTYEAAASSVVAFLNEVTCTPASPRAHLVGYSMGGRVALGVVQQAPEKLYSLTLESCNLGCVSEEERTEAAQRNNGWAAKLREEGIVPFVEYWEALPMFETQREMGFDALLREERQANDAQAMALCLEGMGKHAMPLQSESMGTLAAAWLPIKYIWGYDDPKSESVAHLFGHEGFDVTSFGTGHNVHLEAPSLYTGAVQEFLSGLEPKGC